MKTKVRNYTSEQLLKKVKSLESYVRIPNDYWILGVRSNEDTYDIMDDKFYIFKGRKFIMVMSGTTNTGGYGLKNFAKWTKRGTAHIKANEWYHNVWKRGLHRGKMPALKQVRGFKVLRDNNKNRKSGDVNRWSWEENRGLNFHTNNYNLKSKLIRWTIGGWSTGCQVPNDVQKYVRFLSESEPQELFTYCLIDEFQP